MIDERKGPQPLGGKSELLGEWLAGLHLLHSGDNNIASSRYRQLRDQARYSSNRGEDRRDPARDRRHAVPVLGHAAQAHQGLREPELSLRARPGGASRTLLRVEPSQGRAASPPHPHPQAGRAHASGDRQLPQGEEALTGLGESHPAAHRAQRTQIAVASRAEITRKSPWRCAESKTRLHNARDSRHAERTNVNGGVEASTIFSSVLVSLNERSRKIENAFQKTLR